MVDLTDKHTLQTIGLNNTNIQLLHPEHNYTTVVLKSMRKSNNLCTFIKKIELSKNISTLALASIDYLAAINLTQCVNLRTLKLSDIKCPSIQVCVETLELVELSDCKMTRSGWKRFLDDFKLCKHCVNLKLHNNVNLGDDHVAEVKKLTCLHVDYK